MNELMTRESGQMAALFRMLEHALDHIELLAENYRPVLGGERYLTDREVAKLLKTCRRTCLISSWEGKSCTGSRISNGC